MSNAVVSLAIETVQAGYGALIFCSSRQGCQSMATLVSEAIPNSWDITNEILDKRKDVISDLRSLAGGLDETLGMTVIKGVAFHRSYSTSTQFSDYVD